MGTFVLVSGAWHAGWCWERIVPLLEAQGHRALAPDLLGMGDNSTPPGAVTLAGWAEQIAAIVMAQGEPVILVGHSRGGVVISAVAERVPDRIASLVYLAAALVPSGESLVSHKARLTANPSPPSMIVHDNGTSTCRPEAVGPWFYGMTAPEWVERAAARLCPEPLAPMTTPLQLTGARFGSVRRAYIECTQDRAMTLVNQREMQAILPCAAVATLDSDHSPFYSAPDALVDALLEVAPA
jgi:pimeloyl-ACP methyl ester carboxylesterase